MKTTAVPVSETSNNLKLWIVIRASDKNVCTAAEYSASAVRQSSTEKPAVRYDPELQDSSARVIGPTQDD